MPKDITGLSILGDTITLPGYAMTVALPLSGTNVASATASCTNITMATGADRNASNDSIIVTMAENISGADREGILTVSVGDLEQKYRIVQKAKSLGIIVLSGGGIVDCVLSLDATAETEGKTINVKASSAWKFEGDENPTDGYTKEWVTISDVTGNTGEGSFKLTAEANTTFNAREVEIKVVNTVKEGIYSILTVKQAGKPETIAVTGTAGTDLTDNVLNIAADETSDIELTVDAVLKDAATWEVVALDAAIDWITVVPSVENNKITITPTTNSGTETRSVNITVQKVDDPTVKQVITVTQAGATI
ncbi:MAG: hypothetical protein LUD46_11150 [Parabacteroides sp.]|nr:hypothetical protein [Parabacteroides sp.]